MVALRLNRGRARGQRLNDVPIVSPLSMVGPPHAIVRLQPCERAGPWTNFDWKKDWEYELPIAAVRRPAALLYRIHCGGSRIITTAVCKGESLDPRRLKSVRDRTRYPSTRAKPALTPAFRQMQHFARELFLLSRQCGARGLPKESKELFAFAKRPRERCVQRMGLQALRSHGRHPRDGPCLGRRHVIRTA